MSKFPEFRAYLLRRQTDLQEELELLQDLETDRSALLNQGLSRLTDRAVQAADTFTDGKLIREQVADRVAEVVIGATASGLPDTSPVTSTDPTKLFLNESLVLLGLSLKSDPGRVVRGLLRGPVIELANAAAVGQQAASLALSILAQVETEPIGQGQSLPAKDTKVTSVIQDLAQAQDLAERLLANLTGSSTVNAQLSRGIQAFLNSSLTTLSTGVKNLEALATMTAGMVQAGAAVQSAEDQIRKLKTNLINFRATYESRFSGLSADRSQASALAAEIGVLHDTIEAAQGHLTDLSTFRPSWSQELAVLQALAQEARSGTALSVFATDLELAAAYQALVSDISTIPDTDLSRLSLDLLTIRSFLLGSRATVGFREQFASTVAITRTTLTLFRDRMVAVQTAATRQGFASSAIVEQISSMLTNAKITRATDALASGDIGTFLGLAVGDLNPIDRINKEILVLADTGRAKGTSLVSDLSDGFAEILEFEQDDVRADRSFEDSRLHAIADLEDDLERVTRLLLLIDQAESLA